MGTAVAAARYLEALSESLTLSIDRFDVRNIVARYAEPDDMAGMQRISGDLVFPGHPESIAHMLLAGMGVQSNTSVLSGFLYTHRFLMATTENAGNNPLPPYTLEIFRDVTSSQQYRGVQVSQFALALGPNSPLRMTAGLLARSTVNLTATTASFPGSPTDPFAFDTCSITLGGAATALVENFNLSVNNQLEGVPTLDSSTIIAKIRRTGPALVRLSGSLAFENITDYQRFVGQTEIAIQADLFRANSFSMAIDIPRFVYNAFPLGIGDRGRKVVGFEGICRYHTGSAQALEIRVTNTSSGF